MEEKHNAHQLLALLRLKFKEPEYLLLDEVPNATGTAKSRSCDAMAFSLWPSRGLSVIGFEIKCSRTDWMKEKENPAKAEAFARYCDFWYLVINESSIVQNGELPSNWGLICAHKKKLRVVKEAPKLSPEALPLKFFIAAIRRAHDQGKYLARAEFKDRFSEGFNAGIKQLNSEVTRYQNLYEIEKATLSEFEKKSGIRINEWNAGKIGHEVELLSQIGLHGIVSFFERAQKEASDQARRCELAAKVLSEFSNNGNHSENQVGQNK